MVIAKLGPAFPAPNLWRQVAAVSTRVTDKIETTVVSYDKGETWSDIRASEVCKCRNGFDSVYG